MSREIELEEIETAAFKDRYGNKAMPAQVKPQKAARRLMVSAPCPLSPLFRGERVRVRGGRNCCGL